MLSKAASSVAMQQCGNVDQRLTIRFLMGTGKMVRIGSDVKEPEPRVRGWKASHAKETYICCLVATLPCNCIKLRSLVAS